MGLMTDQRQTTRPITAETIRTGLVWGYSVNGFAEADKGLILVQTRMPAFKTATIPEMNMHECA